MPSVFVCMSLCASVCLCLCFRGAPCTDQIMQVGDTPLIESIRKRQLAIVNALLRVSGARVNAPGNVRRGRSTTHLFVVFGIAPTCLSCSHFAPRLARQYCRTHKTPHMSCMRSTMRDRCTLQQPRGLWRQSRCCSTTAGK